jgi:hypothetical protein
MIIISTTATATAAFTTTIFNFASNIFVFKCAFKVQSLVFSRFADSPVVSI